jgi:hypothetical protein
MAEIERGRLDCLLELVEVLGAGRAPGQHLGGARLAEPLEGAMAHPLVGRQVGFLELVDAAAMGGAADHVEVELQRVEDIHHVEHDVRRAQHIAAGIEQDVRGAPLGRRQDALQRLRRQLHAGQQPHRLRHVAEAAGGVGRPLGARPRRLQRLHLGDRHPLADVDALGAGVAAARAAVAGVEPLLQPSGRRPAARQGRQLADPQRRLAGIEADLARGRTDLETLAAAGAAIRRLGCQGLQPIRICTHADLLAVRAIIALRRVPKHPPSGGL